MPERLIVVGGDAAGMTAASMARKRRGPDELEIVAFERGSYTSYSACGIPYFVGDVVDGDDLVVRSPEEFKSKQSIDARIHHEVTEIDLDKRIVKVWDGSAELVEGFDQLMIGTGAVPIRPSLPNADAENIFGVQVLDDGIAIREAVDRLKPKSAVVIGGGYIGVEMAEAFVTRGIEVTLVDRAPAPMSRLDPDMGKLIADKMAEMGIELHLEEGVEGFETKDGRVSAVVTSKHAVPAELVVLGIGVRPNISLAEQAGIPIGSAGGIAVDRRMQTGVDGVWAAGDCAEKFHLVSRKPVTIALGTHANKEGRVAGINISGGYATFPGVVGTAASKLCGVEVARTGLQESEARDAGFDYVTVTTNSTTRAGYYPDAKKIAMKVIAEKRSGRLLGAQIVGEEGAAKRIDVFATALWNEMTVDAMMNMDLSYAPPFAPVWDPVLIAARRTWDAVQKTVSDSAPEV
jgi:NADPH-dependent 2,4-dienoyl-CoA reductase/sulfur reductase-like enzyme